MLRDDRYSSSNGKFRQCIPLLKFDDEDRPHLCEAGLAALAALPPPVSIVNLFGDGRCGKSTLASRLVHDNDFVFPIGDTGRAVTEGIDMCVIPRSEGDGNSGATVVLDCEGGNNPTGSIRSAVDLVAMLASTLTVQVVWGQTSEGQLSQIGQAIASRDRLLTGSQHQQLPTQRLLLVVNGCHLKYSADQLSKTLTECYSGTEIARNELRANIKRAYPEITFCTVPVQGEATYNSKLEEFQRTVWEQCVPVFLAGSKLSGAQVTEMLKSTVQELRIAGEVPIPSVFRHVIFDNLLHPLICRLASEFEAELPDLSDGEFRPLLPDRRNEVYLSFDRKTQQLTHSDLVAEAREELSRHIEVTWTRVFEQNVAIGEQNRDVATESEMRYSHSEERVVGWKRSCGWVGPKRPETKAVEVMRLWTRTRMLKKNGQLAHSDWAPSSHSTDGSRMGDWNCYTGAVAPQPWPESSKQHSMMPNNMWTNDRNCFPEPPSVASKSPGPSPVPSPRLSLASAMKSSPAIGASRYSNAS